MTSYMSKDQNNFGFSVHEPFKENKENLRRIYFKKKCPNLPELSLVWNVATGLQFSISDV